MTNLFGNAKETIWDIKRQNWLKNKKVLSWKLTLFSNNTDFFRIFSQKFSFFMKMRQEFPYSFVYIQIYVKNVEKYLKDARNRIFSIFLSQKYKNFSALESNLHSYHFLSCVILQNSSIFTSPSISMKNT